MNNKILMPIVLAGLMAGSLLGPGTAQANPGDMVTECVPYHPYPRANHQECTVYIYGNDGSVIASWVYYIDESGQWYIQ